MAFLLPCCADAAWCTGARLLLMLLPSAANAAKAAKCLIPWRAPPCVCRGRRIYIYVSLFVYPCLFTQNHSWIFSSHDVPTFHLRFTCCPADCPELHRCPGDPGCVRGTGFLLGFQNRDGRESDALQLQVSAMSHEDWLYPWLIGDCWELYYLIYWGQ